MKNLFYVLLFSVCISSPSNQTVFTKLSNQIPKTINLNDFVFNMSKTASITAAFCNNDYSLLKDLSL